MASIINIDIEKLISSIEARPCLWDKKLAIYRDRNATKKAWTEVCVELKRDFEALDKDEKNSFGKEVMKRWANVRDAFVKSVKKQKEAPKSRVGAYVKKKYIYNDQLQFLKKGCEEQRTCKKVSKDVENPQEGTSEHEHSGVEQTQEEQLSRRSKSDEVELRLIAALEQRPLGRHLSFFNAIIPSLENFDDDDIVQFQIRVLQAIVNIKQQQKRQKRSHSQRPIYTPSPESSTDSSTNDY